VIKSWELANLAASIIYSSVTDDLAPYIIFSRIEVSKSAGFWLTIETYSWKLFRSKSLMFTPSSNIYPY